MRATRGGPLPAPKSGGCGVTIQMSPPFYWCPLVLKRHIYEEMGVPQFVDYIRALTVRFQSRLADVGNPLIRQLGRYLR